MTTLNNISSLKPRTRFAPSPTGYPHIGTIWQALMQWLYIRHVGGTFILRIEDTDRQRFIEDAEQKMVEALHWYGLDYDEGPDIGGAYGPYRQSERLEIYREHAALLLKSGEAYHCFCSPDELLAIKREQQSKGQPPRYPGRCRNLRADEVSRRLNHESSVIRMKFPVDGQTRFHDVIRGQLEFQNILIEDQILLKADGWPTYHLAATVDDHFMAITTVIRGEEWLPSTPKHIVLYQMFGWDAPTFAHLPLILGPDRSKLSKRHGSTEAIRFRDEGYLADAMINYLSLLGWNPKTNEEIFDRAELIRRFSLEDMNKSGAIFDRQKLIWFNAHYLRALSPTQLIELVLPLLVQAGYLERVQESYHHRGNIIESAKLREVILGQRDRAKTLLDFIDLTAYFFADLDYEASLLIWKNSSPDIIVSRLQRMAHFFSNLSDDTYAELSLEPELKKIIEVENLGVGETLWPLRVALSGRRDSAGPFTLAATLGKTETLRRLQQAITKLSAL